MTRPSLTVRAPALFTVTSLIFVVYLCKQEMDDRKETIDNETRNMKQNNCRPPSADQLVEYSRSVPVVWVGGIPRSGTTLMRVILDAHPDIVCGAETRVIPRMLSIHQAMERSDTEMAWLHAANITNNTIDQALGAYILTVVSRHIQQSAPATSPRNGRQMRLCSKDPFALRSMQRLLRVFPESRFILMVRDGRAVADSIVSGHVTIRGFDVESQRGALGDWNRVMSTMYAQCLTVAGHHNTTVAMLAYGLTVGADRCLPVYYEQLVLRPAEQINKILKFIDVDWNEIVLRHETTIGQPHGVFLSQKEFSSEQVRRPINRDSLLKWTSNTPTDLRTDVHSIAPMLQLLGYDINSYPPDYSQMSFRAEQLLIQHQQQQQQQQQQEEMLQQDQQLQLQSSV